MFPVAEQLRRQFSALVCVVTDRTQFISSYTAAEMTVHYVQLVGQLWVTGEENASPVYV